MRQTWILANLHFTNKLLINSIGKNYDYLIIYSQGSFKVHIFSFDNLFASSTFFANDSRKSQYIPWKANHATCELLLLSFYQYFAFCLAMIDVGSILKQFPGPRERRIGWKWNTSERGIACASGNPTKQGSWISARSTCVGAGLTDSSLHKRSQQMSIGIFHGAYLLFTTQLEMDIKPVPKNMRNW